MHDLMQKNHPQWDVFALSCATMTSSNSSPPRPAATDVGEEENIPNRLHAVALSYRRGDADAVPLVNAAGKGYLAEKIIEIATEKGIAIHRDADLSALLAVLDIGEEIPLEAFAAVAEILRYVYAANKEMPMPDQAADAGNAGVENPLDVGNTVTVEPTNAEPPPRGRL